MRYLEGLAKKAFDISQLTHFLNPATIQHLALMSSPGMALEGAKRLVAKRGSNLLNTGIEMGKNNQQMNPVTHTFARNFLGGSKLKPYHEGLQIGNSIREQGLAGDDELHYIKGIVDQKTAEREAAAAANKRGKVKNNTLNAFDQYQTGAYHHHTMFNNLANAGAVSQDKNVLPQRAVAQTISAPIAKFLDPTALVRPIVSKVESTQIGSQKINQLFPEGTKRGKMYSGVRNFID